MWATALACSNVALVKYWGKRDLVQNLPVTGSISVTLEGLETRTTVAFEEGLARDEVRLEGLAGEGAKARVTAFLDLVRERAGTGLRARVQSASTFPPGAGLASSASGFAALAAACDAALGLGLSPEGLSALARRGSGSAARSVHGGFVEMRPGRREDGEDAFAVPLGPPDLLPLAILVAVTARGPKAVGSTEGMRRTQTTSPFFRAFAEGTDAALDAMRDALRRGDLARVGEVAEESALRMHASMLGARPPLCYWNGATVEVIHAVAALRQGGVPAWVTIDAGPQAKVLCAPGQVEAVRARLQDVPGVLDVVESRPGPAVRVLETVP